MLSQRRLEFTKLDAITANFHLLIQASEKLNRTIGEIARGISGAVSTDTRIERELDEFLARQLGPVQVAAREFVASEVKLTAPVLFPQQLIGIGFNYRDHAEETSTQLPEEPLFFAMFASAITGPFDPITKPSNTRMLDYEAELALVIGKAGRHIPEGRALSTWPGTPSSTTCPRGTSR